MPQVEDAGVENVCMWVPDELSSRTQDNWWVCRMHTAGRRLHQVSAVSWSQQVTIALRNSRTPQADHSRLGKTIGVVRDCRKRSESQWSVNRRSGMWSDKLGSYTGQETGANPWTI